MSEGYFTIIGGDLDREHRYIGEDEDELHHIPKQEIPADTSVDADSIAPVWKQEKYTKRSFGVRGVTIEFFGLSTWSDVDCISYVLTRYSQDSAQPRQPND